MNKKLSIVLNVILIVAGLLLDKEIMIADMPMVYIVISAVGLVYSFFVIRDDRTAIFDCIRAKYVPMCLLTVLGIWCLIVTVYSTVISFEGEIAKAGIYLAIFALAVIGIRTIVHGMNYDRFYILIAAASGAVISVLTIIYDISQYEWILNIFPMISDRCRISSVLLITDMAVAFWYLEENRNIIRYILMLIAIITDIVMVVNGEYLSVTLLVGFYLLVPIMLITTKLNVKRTAYMLLALVLVTGNMCLLPYCFENINFEIGLAIDGSIYLDIILAVAGFFFFLYWDKLPEKVDESRLILSKFKKGLSILVGFYAVVILSVLFAKEEILVMADEDTGGAIKKLFGPMLLQISKGNTISYAIDKTDILTLILLMLIVLIFVFGGIEHYTETGQKASMTLLIAIVTIAGMIIRKMSLGTFTVSYIFILITAYSNEKSAKIKKARVNIDNIKALLGEELESSYEKIN